MHQSHACESFFHESLDLTHLSNKKSQSITRETYLRMSQCKILENMLEKVTRIVNNKMRQHKQIPYRYKSWAKNYPVPIILSLWLILAVVCSRRKETDFLLSRGWRCHPIREVLFRPKCVDRATYAK